jgi:DDE superfamily endonuclease
MKPGHVERREFEYMRHGTKALIAAFDVASGKVRGLISDTRAEADFVSFLDNLFASAPPVARWQVVCDNLNTTCPKGLPAWLLISAASTKASARKGNPASFSRWRRVRRSCAMLLTASLHAETCLLAQPDRDLVLDPGPQTPPPWQLHVQGASPVQDRELHRLLQCHHGQAVPMDDERQAAGRVTCQSEVGLSAGCTRLDAWRSGDGLCLAWQA